MVLFYIGREKNLIPAPYENAANKTEQTSSIRSNSPIVVRTIKVRKFLDVKYLVFAKKEQDLIGFPRLEFRANISSYDCKVGRKNLPLKFPFLTDNEYLNLSDKLKLLKYILTNLNFFLLN